MKVIKVYFLGFWVIDECCDVEGYILLYWVVEGGNLFGIRMFFFWGVNFIVLIF